MTGLNRLKANVPGPASMAALSMGAAHQPSIRLSSPAVAMLVRPRMPSLAVSQRSRVTLWFQASRNVPVSSSLAISGAPQKIPMTPGTISSSAAPNM